MIFHGVTDFPLLLFVQQMPRFSPILPPIKGKRGKSPGRFGSDSYRSAVGCQKMAEFRAIRSDSERMLHLRARAFAPLTIKAHKPLIR
jgi:hypothetical protein